MYDAEFNVPRNNVVINNRVGVHLTAGSSNNQVDGNDSSATRKRSNCRPRDVQWGRTRGNFWSNYSGWDQDGDGAGDVAYEASDLVDRLNWQYPLVKLLLQSTVKTLRRRQFPRCERPAVDQHPRMRPNNQNETLNDKHPN